MKKDNSLFLEIEDIIFFLKQFKYNKEKYKKTYDLNYLFVAKLLLKDYITKEKTILKNREK